MKDRLYGKHARKQLLSWIQRRCIDCKKFLSRRERKYCKVCAERHYREQVFHGKDIYNQVIYYSRRTIRELIKTPIPVKLCDDIKEYS